MHPPLRTTMGRGVAHGERVDGVWSPRRLRCDAVLRDDGTEWLRRVHGCLASVGWTMRRCRYLS
jgi:hypothetical protein